MASQAVLGIYATAVQGLLRLGYSILVGRLGSKALLGATNSALSVSVLAGMAWASPAGTTGNKYVAMVAHAPGGATPGAVASYVARQSTVVSLVLAALATASARVLLALDPWQTLAVFALCWSYALYSTTRGIQFGAGRAHRIAFWDTVSSLVALLALVVVLMGRAHGLLLLPITGSYLLFAIACWPRGDGARLPRELRREITRFTAFLALASVASGGLLQLSQLAAHHYGGDGGAGTFAAALSLATPTSMLGSALWAVLMPPLVRAASAGDEQSVREHSDRVTRQLLVLFVGLFGPLILLAPLLVRLTFGARFDESVPLLQVLLAASLALTVGAIGGLSLTAVLPDGSRLIATYNGLGFIVGIASWPILVPSLGLAGVAAGLLLGASVATIATIGSLWRRLRHRWIGLILRTVGALVVVALGVLLTARPGSLGVALQMGAALVFVGGWGVLHRADLAFLSRTLRPPAR